MIRAVEQSMDDIDAMPEVNESVPASTPPPSVVLTEEEKEELEKHNPIPPPHHPTYLTMIKNAVLALNESKGASKAAILKYLAQHYQLGENLPKINSHLCMALKKALKEGNIEHTKGHGASGSFRIRSTIEKKTKTKGIKVAKKGTIATTVGKSAAKKQPKRNAAVKATAEILKTSSIPKAVKPKKATKAVKKPKTKIPSKKALKKASSTLTKPRVQKKHGRPLKVKAPRAKKA